MAVVPQKVRKGGGIQSVVGKIPGIRPRWLGPTACPYFCITKQDFTRETRLSGGAVQTLHRLLGGRGMEVFLHGWATLGAAHLLSKPRECAKYKPNRKRGSGEFWRERQEFTKRLHPPLLPKSASRPKYKAQTRSFPATGMCATKESCWQGWCRGLGKRMARACSSRFHRKSNT